MNLKNILIVIAVCTVAITATGQSRVCNTKRNNQWSFDVSEQSAMLMDESNCLGNVASKQNFQPAFLQGSNEVMNNANRHVYTTLDGVRIWGNVVYSLSWNESGEAPGFYQYTLSDSKLDMSQIIADPWMFANGSGAFYDGKFHMISKGYLSFLYCSYDIDSWTQLYREESQTKFQKLVASDCDYDPVTGLTYGCFWNPEIKNYEFASVDYESCTHNTIAPMELFSAIAINSKGIVYGIKESDGGLYTIDKITGAQTFIGLTGVKPAQLQSATFDRTTDLLYWAVRQEGGIAYLAIVNTDNGTTKRLAYFPDRAQITCLYIPYHANEDAPAPVKSCKKKTSTSDTGISLHFYMPTLTVAGKELGSQNLNCHITLANKVVRKGQAIPGQVVDVSLDGIPGYNPITIVVSNDKGSSVPLEMRPWCGPETPKAVRDIVVTIDNEANNTVNISWKTADTGIHNGVIGSENITYNIVRMPENKLVGDCISGNSFTEVLGSDKAGVYYYTITPYLGDIVGETVETSKISASGVFSIPYTETFDNSTSFNNFVSVDSNNDGVKWVWNKNPTVAKYLTDWNKNADDWLLTPEVFMRKNQLYVLSFDVQTYGYGMIERLAVAFGSGTDISTYTQILPETDFDNEEPQHQTLIISAPEDGNYRVGYHCITNTMGMYLFIDNISISDGPATGAPASVNNLAVTPDASGLLSANITFTTPTKCVDGTALPSITHIELLRGEKQELIKTFNNVSPGETISFIDKTPVTGVNEYTVIAYNNDGVSIPASVKAYIGQDRPWNPTSVSLEDNIEEYTLTWTPPGDSGMDFEYPVIVDQLTYNIYSPDKLIMVENVQGTTYNIAGDWLTGAQNMHSFFVSAVSPAGESPMNQSNSIITGKPYQLPFRESFKNALPPSTFWWIGGYNVFTLASEMAYDNDGGCICWESNPFDFESWFNSGKIDISKSVNPSFSFAYRVLPGKQFTLKAFVSVDGKADIELGTIDFSTATGNERWEVASFDLTPYIDSNFIIVKIYNKNDEDYIEGQELRIYVDRISVNDAKDTNLSVVAINAPTSLYINQTGNIKTTVENTGLCSAEYTVSLYCGEDLISTSSESVIQPNEIATTILKYTPDVSSADSLTLHAEIKYHDDTFAKDNKSDVVHLTVLRPDYAVVNDLIAEQSQTEEEVLLSWSEPKQDDVTVFESFEDYLHKDMKYGNWTTVDRDEGCVYTNQIVDVGFHNIPMSWAVFNTIAAAVPEAELSFYEAHTGETSLLSIASQPITIKHGDRNDDWLISPEISSSVSHSVSLWAKSVKGMSYGMEQLELLYTTGYSNVFDDFISMGVFSVPSEWTQFSVDIPKGARFFAVRNVSKNLYYLMIDDIEFDIGQMEVLGYNVIRNGVKIASLPATETSYIDTNSVCEKGEVNYYVTVIYENGESGLSNKAGYQTSRIEENVILPEGPFDIYSVNGILVRKDAMTTEGLPRGFYIIGKTKIALF